MVRNICLPSMKIKCVHEGIIQPSISPVKCCFLVIVWQVFIIFEVKKCCILLLTFFVILRIIVKSLKSVKSWTITITTLNRLCLCGGELILDLFSLIPGSLIRTSSLVLMKRTSKVGESLQGLLHLDMLKRNIEIYK